jgi:hypothetical protein
MNLNESCASGLPEAISCRASGLPEAMSPAIELHQILLTPSS